MAIREAGGGGPEPSKYNTPGREAIANKRSTNLNLLPPPHVCMRTHPEVKPEGDNKC